MYAQYLFALIVCAGIVLRRSRPDKNRIKYLVVEWDDGTRDRYDDNTHCNVSYKFKWSVVRRTFCIDELVFFLCSVANKDESKQKPTQQWQKIHTISIGKWGDRNKIRISRCDAINNEITENSHIKFVYSVNKVILMWCSFAFRTALSAHIRRTRRARVRGWACWRHKWNDGI